MTTVAPHASEPQHHRPVVLAGRPASHALADPDTVAESLLRRFAATDPTYRTAHMEAAHEDIVHVLGHTFRLAARVLDGGPRPSDDELATVRGLIAGHAVRGVPLQTMMTVVESTISAMRSRVLAQAGGAVSADYAEANDRLFTFAQRIQTVIPISYVNAAPGNTATPGPGALALALISGRPPAAIAGEFGAAPAPAYTVLRLIAGPQRTASAAGRPHVSRPRAPHDALDAHRGAEELQRRFAAHFGTGTLIADGRYRGILLVPAEPDTTAPDVPSAYRAVSENLDHSAWVVYNHVPVDEVPYATTRTRSLAQLVTRLGHPEDAYSFTDLAFEYQMTRPGPGRDALAARLSPLRPHPELQSTLDAYLTSDIDRRRTARALHVHPNTVDHRLKRIAQLTGYDPARPDGVRQLHTAVLIARFLRGSTPGASAAADRRVA